MIFPPFPTFVALTSRNFKKLDELYCIIEFKNTFSFFGYINKYLKSKGEIKRGIVKK